MRERKNIYFEVIMGQVLNSHNSQLSGVRSSPGVGTRDFFLLPPLLLPVLLRICPEQGHSHHTGPRSFLSPINTFPLQVLPIPGARRLTLAPPSPHPGCGGGGGEESGREGRRESTLSFSLAVPPLPHHHTRRRESIAPCREACALVR